MQLWQSEEAGYQAYRAYVRYAMLAVLQVGLFRLSKIQCCSEVKELGLSERWQPRRIRRSTIDSNASDLEVRYAPAGPQLLTILSIGLPTGCAPWRHQCLSCLQVSSSYSSFTTAAQYAFAGGSAALPYPHGNVICI